MADNGGVREGQLPDTALRARVDFGDVREALLLPLQLSVTAEPGTPIVLFDDHGDQCVGVVDHTDGLITWVEPVWSTWTHTD